MKGLILTQIISSSALSKWSKKIGGYLGPLPYSFFQKSADQNSEIAILFKIVKDLITISLGMTYSPTFPVGGAASYKLWPMFPCIMVIGKCTYAFRGIFLVDGKGLRGRGLNGGNFTCKNLSGGGGGNFHEGIAEFLSNFFFFEQWKIEY